MFMFDEYAQYIIYAYGVTGFILSVMGVVIYRQYRLARAQYTQYKGRKNAQKTKAI